MAGQLKAGDGVPVRAMETVAGVSVPLAGGDRLVHLQFRRFAGCPVCSMHLRTFVRRHPEIDAAGVREVVVFHSSAADVRRYSSELPFDIVADPDKRLYRAFGVESAWRALLDPRAWPAVVTSVLRSLPGVLFGGKPLPPILPAGGSFGLPADFLIGGDGRVIACWYAAHVDDQWSVDQLLTLAGRAPAAVQAYGA